MKVKGFNLYFPCMKSSDLHGPWLAKEKHIGGKVVKYDSENLIQFSFRDTGTMFVLAYEDGRMIKSGNKYTWSISRWENDNGNHELSINGKVAYEIVNVKRDELLILKTGKAEIHFRVPPLPVRKGSGL